MNKTVMLFGFDTLPEIMQAASAMRPLGAEVLPVSRRDLGLTLAELAEGKKAAVPQTAVAFPGKMLVLCGLDAELDAALAQLRRAGIGAECLKAVLTAHNRSWSAARLWQSLQQERSRLQGGAKG